MSKKKGWYSLVQTHKHTQHTGCGAMLRTADRLAQLVEHRLAQLVEHRTAEREVAGSNLGRINTQENVLLL